MLHLKGNDVKSLRQRALVFVFAFEWEKKNPPIWSWLDQLLKWKIMKMCVYVVGEGTQSPLGVLEQGT